MKRRIQILTLLMLIVAECSAVSFRTQRLEQMAHLAQISLGDSLESSSTKDSVSVYRGREVRIKTNIYGEVSHLGYHLFNDTLAALQPENAPVFDFLERYLMELDMRIDGRTAEQRMDLDLVKIGKGSLNMLRQVDTSTPFTIESVPGRMYYVTWQLAKGEVSIMFKANNQLMLGMDLVELEDVAARDIKRTSTLPIDFVINDWSGAVVDTLQGIYVVKGESYVSDLINNDIYLTEDVTGKRMLLFDDEYPIYSVRNVMVTGLYYHDIPMTLRMDRYGGKDDTISVTLQQFTEYCKQQGCKVFFGPKQLTEDLLSGSFFAYSQTLGYGHVLAVEFPVGILSGRDEKVQGRAYVYIPMHELGEKFFNLYKNTEQ